MLNIVPDKNQNKPECRNREISKGFPMKEEAIKQAWNDEDSYKYADGNFQH